MRPAAGPRAARISLTRTRRLRENGAFQAKLSFFPPELRARLRFLATTAGVSGSPVENWSPSLDRHE